jgi:hypothetical protein
MHPAAPFIYAALVLNAEPPRPVVGASFLLAALAAVASPTFAHCLVLWVFTAHLVDVVTCLKVGTAAPIVYAATAPLDQALGHSELVLLHRAIFALRVLCLAGAVMETVFGRKRLVAYANNAACIALGVYAPSTVTVTWLMLTIVVPGKLFITAQRRGISATIFRFCVGSAVFSALVDHEFAFEVSTALVASLSL